MLEYVARVFPQNIRNQLYVLRIVSVAIILGDFRRFEGCLRMHSGDILIRSSVGERVRTPDAFRSTFPKSTFCIRSYSGYIPRQTNDLISVVVIAIWPWVVA